MLHNSNNMYTIFISLLIIAQIFLLFVLLVLFYWMVRGLFGIPWIRTRKIFSKAMLDLAEVKPNETVVDYGCGDGAIVIHAATSYGAFGIGYEYLFLLVEYAKWCVRFAGVGKRVSIRYKNFLSGEKLPHADVVCTYLFPEVNAKLEPLLLRDYPSGTRVVSRTFTFPTLPEKKSVVVNGETVRLYEVP